jgi:serine/threonine protein kinase
MISERGEVKLLDFGIVKAENKLSQTQEGMIKGNVFYMSPEQARGLPVDLRADLFSLGLVLYTAFTGETLYRGVTNYDLLTRAAEGLSKQEWDVVHRLPEELANLLEKALQADPQKRFQSAEEFSRAVPAAMAAPAAAMQKLMEDLFKETFDTERARFVSAAAEHA